MPISSSGRMTRMTISPRFATKTLENMRRGRLFDRAIERSAVEGGRLECPRMNEPASLAFRPQRPDVIDEAFDGEAVLVHMGTGCYFSLNAAATAIWALLQDGRSPGAIAVSLGWEAPLVEAFVERLRAESLVEAAEVDAGTTVVDGRPAASEPVLQRFSDMQDLLMLDPIHDIDLDGDGWPVT